MGSACSLNSSENVVSPNQQESPKDFNQHKSIRYSERRVSKDSYASSESETKVVEVRKAHSFKLPPPRVNLMGFKTIPFGNGKKTTEEVNAEIICSYLPQHLLYNLKSLYYKSNNNSNVNDRKSKALEEEMSTTMSPLSNITYETCILMIDISGFTNLTESLSKEPNGAELLTKYINQYFTTLIAFIYDAIICQFHYPRKDRTLAECVIAAVQCALRIQQTEYLKSFKVNDNISLQIHCGVSLGYVTTHHLGVNDYWLRITSGQALLEMSSALGNSLVGQVVITRPAFEKCSNYITCRKLEIKEADVPPVRNKIDAGQSEWINEVKPLTVGFLSIIDTNKYETKDDEMQVYQTYLTNVQGVLETYEGFIANMLSDEKGTILVFSFGYPVSHISDSIRAVKAGIELSGNLSQLGMKFGLGIASGKCFIGNVGSEYRKEFTIYGDKVNLAARLMKESEKNDGVVLCEEETAQMLKGIPIEPLEPIKVKGKSDLIKIWKVKDSSISSTQMYYNIKKSPSQIMTEDHSESSGKKSYSGSEHLNSLKYPIGREEIFDSICGYVNEKQQEIEQGKKTKTKIIFVKGENGVGKSDLLRRLVSELKSKLACVYNSAIEFETPFYLYLGNLKISITERFYKKNGLDLDYNDVENLYNNISREQREEIMLETFKEEKDRDNLYLLNPVVGTEFKESKDSVKLDQEERITIAADLFARLLSISWMYMGYSAQPWFLLYDDFHFTMQFDPYSRIVTKKILDLEPGITNCVLLLSCNELPDGPQMAEKRKELDEWKAKADLVIDLKEFTKSECEEYLKLYFNASKVDPKVLDIFVEKTEGNQQFLTMALHFLQENGRTYVEDGCLKFKFTTMDTIELPATMSSFFQQKIDRLDVDSQLVLKVASSIGIQFDFETLEAIFPKESNVKKDRKLSDILKNLVGSHQFLEVVEETKGKHFLACSSSKDRTFKFKSSMMLQIVYSTTPKEQKREFHMSLAKHFIKTIEQQCRRHKSRERSSWYIKEIAVHLGHYFDKIALEETLSLGSVEKEEMLHLALACVIIPKAITLLSQEQEASVFKHLCVSFNTILEKIVTLWKGEKEGNEEVKYTDLLDVTKLNVFESVLSLIDITRKRFEGITRISSTFSILGLSFLSVKILLAKSLLKFGIFIENLFDANLMPTGEEALTKAKLYCPESEKELIFSIESERWFMAFYLNKTDEAIVLSSNLINLSTEIGDTTQQMFGSVSCMMTHNTRGNFNKVILFSEDVINQYLSDPDKYHQQSINRFRKRDALLVSCTYSMRALWSVGKYESASKYYTLGSEQSRVRLHLPSYMFFYSFACYYLLISGQLDELERSANQGMSIISIFSTTVASPTQVLSAKFYLAYVQFCRELTSGINIVEKEQRLREQADHMESLFNSLHIYAPPSLIFDYAILESRVKYLEFLDSIQIGTDVPYLEHTETLFKNALASHQENLLGEILRLQSRFLLIKCSLLEASFEECYPNVEKSYSDALQFVSSQSAHGVKLRILLDMYDCYHYLISKGLKYVEDKLPDIISDMDYLMENYIEQHESIQSLNERYKIIKQ
ncbi:hypothetical protein NAEGRDRAFT_66608 [Naegleria gruberi]|uniref:Uncharacterized protein FM146 n=1 Tax=Naegleria gruberi TaxID=5762 RepID=D2VCL0_NAEGR|nr:uncharacterized protein NAEGRDRAFT_66608 [Naegleria gruberi]EFC45434.1 hypothetical protein NAEGRDRAFT_66608 [Naegleria gruberi]|eukprot:XP_002678178.1 hypothetical protein NAEGRDRAFT_66608 [Naegleria gruberi strain NEG-M]